MTTEEHLSILEKKEMEQGLSTFVIGDVPIWELIKHPLRERYLVSIGINEREHNQRNPFTFSNVTYILKSYWDAHKLLGGNVKGDNLFMGFTRFEKVGENYVDKYIDPLLVLPELRENHIYIEYGTYGYHLSKRPKCNRYYGDYINIVSYVGGRIASLYYRIKYKKELNDFCGKASKCLGWQIGLNYCSFKLAKFNIQVALYKRILTNISAKRIFGVSRNSFRHVAFAAKQLGLPVYELQHGITMGRTPLYMGPYNPVIDPDWFLLFGETCPPNVFGISNDRTMTIGWAFFDYLRGYAKCSSSKKCLLISSAEISDKIISVAKDLAYKYPNMIFDIRRHPMEVYSAEQNHIINSIPNVNDVSSPECSAAVIMQYEYILGTNSSVLFEALCMGKKVARLTCYGLEVNSRSDVDGFYYMDDISNFEDFLNSPRNTQEIRAYTKFNRNLFCSLLK